LFAMLPSVFYALAGLIDAVEKREKVNWPLFLKTIIIAALNAGLITQATADMMAELSATTAVTYVLDKLLNALSRFRRRGSSSLSACLSHLSGSDQPSLSE